MAMSDQALLVGGPSSIPPPEPRRGPELLIKSAESQVIRLSDLDRERSHRTRWMRAQMNRKNWDFFHMKQDWTGKLDGQTRLFFPDLPMAVEQIKATIENQLVNFQNWFSIEKLGGLSIFDPDTLRKLVSHVLDRLWKPGNEVDTSLKFPTLLADTITLLLVESEATWKIYGVDSERPIYRLEAPDGETSDAGGELLDDATEFDDERDINERAYEKLTTTITKAFIRTHRLGIDLIPFEDSFPDPSSLNRYHIHETTRHISELRANPDYDPDVLGALANHIGHLEAERDKAKRTGITYSRMLSDDPNQVRVREFWGDLVDPSTGKYLYRNCFFTTAAGRLLRPPTPNPFWHGYRPMIRASLLRTPLAPVHKALIDHAIPSAEAENEIGSLMVDGGIASVWGTRQARPELLADPTSISKGIPPSFTAVLKKGAPPNAKFLERVDEGTNTPQYGMDMLLRLGRGREIGIAIPSYQNGALPPRQVKATEVVEASASSDNLFENISTRLELNLIEPALQLIWLVMWQGMDDFSSPELVEVLGPERAIILQQLTPEERFYLFANGVRFQVRGLRNLMQQMNDFRKLTTVGQTVFANPITTQAFMLKYDPTRMVEKMIRAVNIDPTELEWRASDAQAQQQLMAQLRTPVDPRQATAQSSPGAVAASPPTPAGGAPMPGESDVEGEFAPPNPTGFRGAQV